MARLRTCRRVTEMAILAVFAAVLVLGFSTAANAQAVTDPRIAEFDPSADHDALLGDGQPAVSRYELEVYALGAQAPFHTVDMGKPAPDPDGKIRFNFATQVIGWPLPGGQYEARVKVIGPEGSSVSTPSNPFDFSSEPLEIVTVALDQPTVEPGTAVTWTTETTGGSGPLQYQFFRAKDGGSWTVAQAWGTSPTMTWTPGPSDVGTFQVQVWVRNADSTATYDAWSNGDTLTVYSTPVLRALTPDKTSPFPAGTAVTWTATTTGGVGPLQFQFYRSKDGGAWALVRAWSTSNTFTWTPGALDTGTHMVQVWVRNAGSTATYDTWGNSAPVVVGTPVSVASVTADRSSPLPCGTAITWTAAASGGATPLQYQFWRYKNGAGWTLGRAYATSNTYTWTPSCADAGTYSVQVWVKSTGSPATYEVWRNSSALEVTNSLRIVGVASSPASTATAGTTVTWTATTAGGTGPIQYQFWLYSPATGWSLLRAYSTSATATWTPALTGTYTVQVWVRNAGSTATYDTWANSTTFIVQ